MIVITSCRESIRLSGIIPLLSYRRTRFFESNWLEVASGDWFAVMPPNLECPETHLVQKKRASRMRIRLCPWQICGIVSVKGAGLSVGVQVTLSLGDETIPISEPIIAIVSIVFEMHSHTQQQSQAYCLDGSGSTYSKVYSLHSHFAESAYPNLTYTTWLGWKQRIKTFGPPPNPIHSWKTLCR